MKQRKRGRLLVELRVHVQRPADRRDLGLVAEHPDLLRPDQLGARLLGIPEQQLEPVRRRPVVGVLEQVGVVAGVLDHLLDEPVGPDVSVGVKQRHLREALDEAQRRLSGGVVDDDDPVDRPRLSHHRLEAVLQPLLAAEVWDQREHRRVRAEPVAAVWAGGRRFLGWLGQGGSPGGHAALLEQLPEHTLGGEVVMGDLSCCAAVPPVVGRDCLDGGCRLVDVGYCEQALAGRKHVPEARVLGDHGPAGGEVGGASVAEPAGREPDVLLLGHRELRVGGSDVVAVGVDVQIERRAHAPAALLEPLLVGRPVAAQRQLECRAGAVREIQELLPLDVLAPSVGLSLVADVAPRLPPVADGREARIGRLARPLPAVEHHRLAGRPKLEAIADRQRAGVGAQVLGEGEVGAVRVQELHGRFAAVVKLDLELDGIGLEVDEAAARAQLRPRLGAAVQVDDQLGLPVERGQLALAHAERAAVVVQRLVGPAIGQAVAAEHGRDERGGASGAVVGRALHQHRRRPRVRLDVVGIEAEAAQPQQVVQGLPDHARNRCLRHHAEHDDPPHAASSFGVRPRSSSSRRASRLASPAEPFIRASSCNRSGEPSESSGHAADSSLQAVS